MKRPILLLGEAWGAEEERRRLPFVGASGRLLNMLLRDAGIAGGRWMEDTSGKWIDWQASPEVYATNVFNVRPRPTNDIANIGVPRAEGLPGYPALAPAKYIPRGLAPELLRMEQEIRSIDPHLIIALGGTALMVLTKSKLPISKNRGTLFQSYLRRDNGNPYKVLPTFHPAAVAREWSHRPIVIADLLKAKKHATSPEFTRPSREIWIAPTLEDLVRFEAHFDFDAPCAVDIETAHGTITEIGFAPSPTLAIVVPFYSRRDRTRNYWPDATSERAAWLWVQRILGKLKRPVFQNGLYDLHYLWRTMRIKVPGAGEDTMLLHHSLQPEMQKSLGFLGSIYTDEPAWKLMRQAETVKTED